VPTKFVLVTVGGTTVNVVIPEILPDAALMVAVPAAIAAPKPPLLIDATEVLEELQVTSVVISWLVPSEYRCPPSHSLA
jgi:hypothetical protein